MRDLRATCAVGISAATAITTATAIAAAVSTAATFPLHVLLLEWLHCWNAGHHSH